MRSSVFGGTSNCLLPLWSECRFLLDEPDWSCWRTLFPVCWKEQYSRCTSSGLCVPSPNARGEPAVFLLPWYRSHFRPHISSLNHLDPSEMLSILVLSSQPSLHCG
jgi:hypothetical protein